MKRTEQQVGPLFEILPAREFREYRVPRAAPSCVRDPRTRIPLTCRRRIESPARDESHRVRFPPVGRRTHAIARTPAETRGRCRRAGGARASRRPSSGKQTPSIPLRTAVLSPSSLDPPAIRRERTWVAKCFQFRSPIERARCSPQKSDTPPHERANVSSSIFHCSFTLRQ